MNPKVLWGALALSLAVNIFIAGVFLGRPDGYEGPAGDRFRDESPKRPRFFIQSVGKAWSASDIRSVIRTEMKANARELQEMKREQRAIEEELRTLLISETLDKEAFLATAARWKDVSGRLRQASQDIWLKIIREAPLEARQRAAEIFFSEHRGGRRRQRRAEGPPRP